MKRIRKLSTFFCRRGLSGLEVIAVVGVLGLGYGIYNHVANSYRDQGAVRVEKQQIQHQQERLKANVEEVNEYNVQKTKKQRVLRKKLRSNDPRKRNKAALESLER